MLTCRARRALLSLTTLAAMAAGCANQTTPAGGGEDSDMDQTGPGPRAGDSGAAVDARASAGADGAGAPRGGGVDPDAAAGAGDAGSLVFNTPDGATSDTGAAGDAARPGSEREVVSPGGLVRAEISLGATLAYQVSWKGKPVITGAGLSWQLEGGGSLGPNLKLVAANRREVHDRFTSPTGKRRMVEATGNELTLELQESAGAGRRVDLILRAYDDGFALRYRFPGNAPFRLTSEKMEFKFTGNHDLWGSLLPTILDSGYEFPWLRSKIDNLRAGEVWAAPMLINAGGVWTALVESNVVDWPATFLRAGAAGSHAVVTELSPRNDQRTVAVIGSQKRTSPWRVVLLGDRAGAPIESDLVRILADPPVGDFSWVKPGVSSWDSWWVGGYWPDERQLGGMNNDMVKSYIQLAADMGWQYMTLDWGWYGDNTPGHDTNNDMTRPLPGLDLPMLLRFAKDRNVGVFLWIRVDHAAAQMDRAFPLYQQWGVAGIKVDFARREDQTMVNQFRRLMELAARNRLMVLWHNAGKPSGMDRTFPNLLGRENVAGNEQSKWSTKANPTHATILPFTRMLAGPMDYTPGGFRNVARSRFVASRVDPQVMGSRAHQLAMLVVYESGLPTLCDKPSAYRGQDGADFLKEAPAAWDDTRVLDGVPGERIAIARRSGQRWFVGVMGNDDKGRHLDLPLSFLGAGSFQARIWADGPATAQTPTALVKSTRTVTAADTLSVDLSAVGGGYVAVLAPMP